MATCLCLHVSAQVVTKPTFQQMLKIRPRFLFFTSFVHAGCPCFGLFISFFFFSPYNMCFSAMNSTSPLLLSICLMVSYAVLAVANFLTGSPSCFLSKELCFGMGQEVVFKLIAFCSLLICTLGHALLLRVI